jgi:parallel beta-helix repeat protein/predicted outer membrane repeat protein
MNWKKNSNIWLAVGVLLAVLTWPAGADTHYVGPGDSIQAAINAADNDDEIEVFDGWYSGNINFNGKAVRLYSLNGPWSTTIDGAWSSSVVTCNSGEGSNTILEGFTITNGNSYNGGGMHNNGSSPTVTNCRFESNAADYGGGMFNDNSSDPDVTNCTFYDNTANVWGAGMFNKLSSPTVTNCNFNYNNAGWDGGGMFNELSSPTVTDCNFIANTAVYSGGGMYSKDNSSPTVTDCNFSNNVAVYGGGMLNQESSPAVTDCSFWSNDADYGGGMFNEINSSPTVTDCNFTVNMAWQSGGGMYSKIDSSPNVTNCTFNGNQAHTEVNRGGGGMYNWSGSPTVTNCVFTDNKAGLVGVVPMHGGGIYNFNSDPNVTNCTFSGNRADGPGGGIYSKEGSSPTLQNCILWGNTPDQMVDSNSTTSVYFSDVQGGWPGLLNIDADPLFVNAAGGDLRLSSSASPCVDSGNNNAASIWIPDLAGNQRIIDGDKDGTATVDMGAYELQNRQIHNITQDRWYDSIQISIDDANDGDQIEVGPGTHYEPINFNGKAVRLYSSGGAEVTTFHGTGHYHVVQCVNGEDANTILEGFTITGGDANGSYPDSGGGGMLNYNNSSPTVTNCTFRDNAARHGGGMANRANSSPMVTNCTFSSNTALEAGGLDNYDNSSPTVTNCIFSGNSATGIGGGMYNLTICSPTVTNCTFIGNSAGSDGGGMDNRVSSNPNVTNCTFGNNSATGKGGGIDNYDSNPKLTNCILWGDEPNEISNNSSNPSVTYSDVQGGTGESWFGEGCIDADPCFVDANNPDPNLLNLRLEPDSPCIDTGDTTAVPGGTWADLGGNPRVLDDPLIPDTGVSFSGLTVDMGAYEFRCSGIAGDVNCDGVVNFKDVAILAGNWLAGTEP